MDKATVVLPFSSSMPAGNIMEITFRGEGEMRSCYGDSQIERIKSPLSVAVKRET